ncbi:MAG TPA: polyphosphate kinase 1 [Elusimicrobia bacterium]|nr:MAG: polyphosphate kinase 1 [Elusimicrobia bacterium GWA2_66_18]OGR72976.1 MAG: polyphosphate kinase 1 [Elusimicrobia bacterium GWC2_65_9]HAZ08564.1 polyphosphate kinase 1 [Elusimicrobiota bacterium]
MTRSKIQPIRIDEGPSAAPKAQLAGLRASERFFNRDLSWLAFNDRVLSEAADPTVPSLERLRFATIVSSNLDEFFMVRVAEVAKVARRSSQHRFLDGMSARQALAQIREHALRQKSRQAVVLQDVLAALKADGIEVLAEFLDEKGPDAEIQERLPRLRTVVRRYPEPPPPLVSERIHVFVRFPREYAIVTIEERDARLVSLSTKDGTRRYALLERWIADRAEDLFCDREVIETFPFKIIRDADLRWRPDDEGSLEDQILEAVQRRLSAKVARLEVDSPSYSEGALFLATALGLDSSALYRFDLPLDLRTLARIEATKPGQRYPPIEPQVPAPFRSPSSTFEVVRRKDILLHHPYDSFDIVVKFLEAAAQDAGVRRIYHTLYRTSQDSPIMGALKLAAANGKKVTAYVEIKARFDELNNLRWAEELRKSGVRVVRHLGRFKVHSKVTAVAREENGAEVIYSHLGTGNYHPVTARQYTDLGLLTADPGLGREALSYFESLDKGRRPEGFLELLVAPVNLHDEMLRLIREETRNQKSGARGRIIAKMNSLQDPELVEALYEASNAGVKIDLLVRGICCLRPGIAGMSENIRVVSVVDRFLEHSRIYYFRAGGVRKIYLSSADWMPRNFYSRYEVAFPVKDATLKRYIHDTILGKGLADNQKAWMLKPDGSYARVHAGPATSPVRSQAFFEALARSDYRDTALEQRTKVAA